jgi:hypothetical protein
MRWWSAQCNDFIKALVAAPCKSAPTRIETVHAAGGATSCESFLTKKRELEPLYPSRFGRDLKFHLYLRKRD